MPAPKDPEQYEKWRRRIGVGNLGRVRGTRKRTSYKNLVIKKEQ